MENKEDSNKEVDINLLALTELLECTICLDVAAFPIFNCVPNGHIICGICHEKVKECGMCKSPLSLSVFGEALSKKVVS
jgi:hypothetical protein